MPEAARDHDSSHALEHGGVPLVELLGADPADVDLDAVVEPCVLERLDHAQVGVGQRDVLADNRDRHQAPRPAHALQHLDPGAVVGLVLGVVEVEVPGYAAAQPGVLEQYRHLVDRLHVGHRDHTLAGDVAEERDLVL